MSRIRNAVESLALNTADRMLGPLRKDKPGDDPYHRLLAHFIHIANTAENASILEIGSRNVSGSVRRSLFPNAGRYVGVDIHAGENVDVVGDVHRLSELVGEKQFDFVYSISVFEHLAFPWKVALEINAALKPGGVAFMSSHPFWPTHELPWDFWRFMLNSMHCLFNQATGFEIIAATEGLPARMFSLVGDPPTRHNHHHTVNQGIAVIARKIGDYDRSRLKWDLTPSDIMETMYPTPSSHP